MRFSIRDLLWLTALVAVAFAWGLDRQISLSKMRRPPPVYDIHVDEKSFGELKQGYGMYLSRSDDGYIVTTAKLPANHPGGQIDPPSTLNRP